MQSILKVFAEAKSLQSRLAALAKPLAAESVHPSKAPTNQNVTSKIQESVWVLSCVFYFFFLCSYFDQPSPFISCAWLIVMNASLSVLLIMFISSEYSFMVKETISIFFPSPE